MDTFDPDSFEPNGDYEFDESLDPILSPPPVPMDLQVMQLGAAFYLRNNRNGRTAVIRHDTSQVSPDLWHPDDPWTVHAWNSGPSGDRDGDLVPLSSCAYPQAFQQALYVLRLDLDQDG